jgi:hypothetical protein
VSEYCDTCEEVLDWLHDNMDDRDNCVKCQIKAAKLEVLENLKELFIGCNTFVLETLMEMIAEVKKKPTATQLGYEVGKVYFLPYDKRCTYHIVCETHYTAVFVDGSEEPKTHEIGNMGKIENDSYALYDPVVQAILPGATPVPKLKPDPRCTCGADYVHGNQCPLFGGEEK